VGVIWFILHVCKVSLIGFTQENVLHLQKL
jgi:hypothetical protein